MPNLFDLLLAYGLCFGLMNKVDFPRKISFFDRMLSCSYCTGFHAGWLSWIGTSMVRGFEPASPTAYVAPLLWAFMSAGFCYLVDSASQLVESWARRAQDQGQA